MSCVNWVFDIESLYGSSRGIKAKTKRMNYLTSLQFIRRQHSCTRRKMKSSARTLTPLHQIIPFFGLLRLRQRIFPRTRRIIQLAERKHRINRTTRWRYRLMPGRYTSDRTGSTMHRASGRGATQSTRGAAIMLETSMGF